MKSKSGTKEPSGSNAKVVRVALSESLHTTLEDFQRVHKILHGNKISKEQIIVNMLETPQLLEALSAMKEEAKNKI